MSSIGGVSINCKQAYSNLLLTNCMRAEKHSTNLSSTDQQEKKLHFKTSKLSQPKPNINQSTPSSDHFKNVQTLITAWSNYSICKDLELLKDEATFKSVLKDFKPFDLEDYWGKRQLEKLSLNSTNDD